MSILRGFRFVLVVLLSVVAGSPVLFSATKLLVTVVDRESMVPVTDLKPGELVVKDGKRDRRVEKVEKAEGLLDVVLLVDSSVVGEMVQPAAANIIEQLGEKDQMSIVAFDSAATLVQDFTSSKQLLLGSLQNIKYGNNPNILDAVFATIDGAFTDAGVRRAIILITAGLEAGSRVSEGRLYRIARRNQVSVYPLFVSGWRGMFRDMAEKTGAVALNLPDMAKKTKLGPGETVFELIQSQYVVTIGGDLALGEKAKIELTRDGKYRVGWMELD